MQKEEFSLLSKYLGDATVKIFKTMVTPSTKVSEVEVISEKISSFCEVFGRIDISGTAARKADDLSFDGSFSLLFSKDSYLKVASKMLMEEYTDINDDNDDVASELVNMIVGNAKSPAAESGIKLSMSSPKTSILADENSFVVESKEFLSCYSVSTDLGDAVVLVALALNN